MRVIKTRRTRWAEHAAHMVDRRGAYRVLMGESWGKRLLGRPRPRWEDLQEVRWGRHGLERSGSG